MNAIFKPTGEMVVIVPWVAQTPRPWGDRWERIMRFLSGPTRKGHLTEELIVRRDKLNFKTRG